MKKFNLTSVILSLFSIIFLLGATGCNLPNNAAGETPETPNTSDTPEIIENETEAPDENSQISETDLGDENAQIYRMIFDSPDGNNVQVKKFIAQIRIADIESIFGDVHALPKNENGNYVGGPFIQNDMVWYLLLSASEKSLNLVGIGKDGSINSAIDADGDRVTDIVDMRLPDGRRFIFLNEQMGLDIFKFFQDGKDPWCEPGLAETIPGLEAGFGCGKDESADGGSSPGGTGAGTNGLEGTGIVDPLDLACAGFATGNQAAVTSRLGQHAFIRSGRIQTIFRENAGDTRILTQIHETSSGEYTHTTRIILDYAVDGRLISRTDETVDADGHGHRTTVYYDTGETQRLPLEEDFEAEFEGDVGHYDSYKTSPPLDNPHPADAEETSTTEVYVPRVPIAEDPGPEGDDRSLAEFCARRGNSSSGAEEAAAKDPTVIGVSCNDLVGAPSNNDCVIIAWAKPDDFMGALDTSGGDSCGEFYQDDGSGNCEPRNAIERLRGNAAEIASIKLDDVVICPPIVCDPTFASQARQPISDSNAGSPEGGFPSTYTGTVTDLVLCYEGPGDNYPVVSSLKAGEQVEIFGIGAVQGWYVVNNPIYQGDACWVSDQYLKPDSEISPDLLPSIPPPILIGNSNQGGNNNSVDQGANDGNSSQDGNAGGGDQNGNNNNGGGNTPNTQCGPDEYFSNVTQSCQTLQ